MTTSPYGTPGQQPGAAPGQQPGAAPGQPTPTYGVGTPGAPANPPLFSSSSPTYGTPGSEAGYGSPVGDQIPVAAAASGTPTPTTRKPSTMRIVLTAVVLVIALGVGGFVIFQQSGSALGRASKGDCVAGVGEGKDLDNAKRVDCSDSSATYQVLDKVSSETDCLKVAGTEAAVPTTKRSSADYLCLITKGADPSQGANTIKAGDCLKEDSSATTGVRKSDCSSGSYPVQAVITDPRGITEANAYDKCTAAGASDPEQYYEWAMLKYSSVKVAATADLVFCVGAKN